MSETDKGLSRRTLAKGVAWSIPAVAATAYAPAYAASPSTTTTTLPPCVGSIGAVGGTYPVTVSLSGCGGSANSPSSHWDFNFLITAATQNCDCTHLRVTLFDNPNRSRLWIQGNLVGLTGEQANPQNRTANDPRLFVQKVLAVGASATFPDQGDTVRRVGGSAPWNGYETDSGTAIQGTITAHGTANDSLHTLILADGSIPCGATGPMAYIRVECGQSATGPWEPLGGLGEINPCVPMITSTVCRYDTTGNGRFQLGVSVLNSCGISASNFRITKVQRNNDTNFPNDGDAVWTGDHALGAGVTNIQTTEAGSGGQLWIDFTTDGGVNTSTIRVPTSNTVCAGCAALAAPTTRSACKVSGDSNSTSIHRYTWSPVTGAASYDVRYSTNTSDNNPNWVTAPGVTSPYTTVAGVRRLQVRTVNTCDTAGGWSTTTSVSGSTPDCPPAGRIAEPQEAGTEPSGTQSGSETSESSPTEPTESSPTSSSE